MHVTNHVGESEHVPFSHTRRFKVLLWSLLCMAGVITIELAVFDFLPSAVVTDYSGWITLGGVVLIAVWIFLKWERWKAHIKTANLTHMTPGLSKRLVQSPRFGAFLAIFCSALMLYLFSVRFAPHLIARMVGEPGQQEFTFHTFSGESACPNGIMVEEPSFLASRVCNAPERLGDQLVPGMKVIVHGKKSWAGIIPESIEIKAEQ